jgi:hypothetical protein
MLSPSAQLENVYLEPVPNGGTLGPAHQLHHLGADAVLPRLLFDHGPGRPPRHPSALLRPATFDLLPGRKQEIKIVIFVFS